MTKAVHLTRMRSIEYKVDLVPEGGFLHAASVATLTKSFSKDPAGHTFHELALKQAGLYGACWVHLFNDRVFLLVCCAVLYVTT